VTMFIPFMNIVAFVVLSFLPGNPGPNRFGPDTNLPG